MVSLATDNFNRANSSTLGANWTDAVVATYGITSNAAQPAAFATDLGTYYNAVVWPNDQYSKGTVTETDDGNAVSVNESGPGFVVRQAASGETFYWLNLNHLATNNVTIAKEISGVYTDLGQATRAWTNGDIWEYDVVGTSLTAKRVTTTILSTTDSSLSSGSAGLGYSGTSHISAATVDNWDGGDFTTTDLPPGLGPVVSMQEPALTADLSAMMR